MSFVIDASVALKWFLKDEANEQDVDRASMVLNGIVCSRLAISQPPHWEVEIIAVMARRHPSAVSQTLHVLGQLMDINDVHVLETAEIGPRIYLRAAEIAQRLNQHVFDTLYHALALDTGATLITADERYFNAASGEGAIKLLKNFEMA